MEFTGQAFEEMQEQNIRVLPGTERERGSQFETDVWSKLDEANMGHIGYSLRRHYIGILKKIDNRCFRRTGKFSKCIGKFRHVIFSPCRRDHVI